MKHLLWMGGALAVVAASASLLYAQAAPAPTSSTAVFRPLGGAGWQGWTGLRRRPDGTAALPDGVVAAYQVPDGPKGWYSRGLSGENDGTIDARQWYGIRFDARTAGTAPFDATLTAAIPPQPGRRDMPGSTTARTRIQGTNWHTVTVPFTSFDYNRGQGLFLKFLKTITLSGRCEGAPGGGVLLRGVRLVRGDALHLECAVRSLPAEGDSSVSYPVTVLNTADRPETVSLDLRRTGFEGMPASVTPAVLSLRPGASGLATVRVAVPSRIPGGAQETQTLVVTPEGDAARAETMTFITLRRLPFPYLVLDQAGWDAVRAKAAKYDWAKADLADVVATADSFQTPVVPPGGIPSTQGTPALFPTYIENRLWPCAEAWKLTGRREYAEKVAQFLRRLSDPRNGYPVTLHAAAADIPQEGGLFEGAARSYDAIADSGVLTDADRRQIEDTFRLYIRLQIEGLAGGGISNWSVFNLCPAAECALAVQDMVSFNALTYGAGGVVDHLRYGTMDDGWWYEMSLAYNLGCAEAFTDLGLAAEPFGIDLLNAKFPASLTQNVGLRPFEYENFEGMAFGKFGPVKDNFIDIKKMWDGITPYPDYRGVMFGMGDGHEERVSGSRFDEAYYAFRDPAYAAVIKQGHDRDLLFGVPDLPADTPTPYKVSAHSEDAGIAVLRSQTVDRLQRDQIQASFKYGTHGSYHGHFDRLALNSLERDGISFYNPETSWFGYGSYLYKWWVQPSLSHNMVVVDGRMQEPKECRLLLFHSGPMVQAVAAETDARWSNPPYMGGYDQIKDIQAGDKPYVPIPADHPRPGDIGPYSEPVRQRRLMVVTDDYVVLADDLRGQRAHTFDDLLQLRGAALADPARSRFLGRDAQFDADPLSSGQFITNVDRYAVTAPALVQSVHRIPGAETGGAKSLSEPGALHIDEHILWPPASEVRIGDYAESWGVGKKLTYAVRGDGRILASGAFGAWILGDGNIDVDVTGLKTLQLSTEVVRGKATLPTVFWGGGVLVTADGREIPLSRLKATGDNVIPNPHPGQDYEGGPVRIAGVPFAQSVAAEPQDVGKAATITIDLTGLNAVRLKATVGGDWPVGDEGQLRKTVSVRTTGKTARFLTLIEPYETTPMVKSAVATGPDSVHVELTDGRVQEIDIQGLDSGGDHVSVTVTESLGGKVIRTEKATSPSGTPLLP